MRTLGQEAAARVHEQRADNEGAKNEVAKKVAEVTALTQAASAAVSEFGKACPEPFVPCLIQCDTDIHIHTRR